MPTKTVKHYFITGVSSGIGYALASRLCRDGHNVSGVARRDAQLSALEAAHPTFKGYVCDVTDKDALNKAVAGAKAQFGAIDVLIPNAGIYIPQNKTVIDIAAFQKHIDVNYMAVISCLAAILPDMVKRNSGHIALMASVAGYRGLPRSSAYGPTKAAIINLGEALRFDLADTKIKLQTICPGFVETEATAVNDFEMPELITAEQAADEICLGLAGNQFEIAFPKSFARKMKWLKLMPTDMYFSLVKRMTGNSARK